MHQSKKNKKALLIISDGGDNHSRYTIRRKCNTLVRESDVLIYAIGVFGGGTTPEEAGGPGLLIAHRRTDRRPPVL